MEKTIKHIAIYCNRMAGAGGVERVAVSQLKMFNDFGYRVCFITEEEPGNNDNFELPLNTTVYVVSKKIIIERSSQWKEILLNNNIDVVIYHHAVQEKLIEDSNAINDAGVYLVVTIHFSFLGPFNLIESWNFNALALQHLQKANAIICLSHTEQLWWQGLGFPAYYIPNPLSDIEVAENYSESKIIVWIGRIHSSKQPEHALIAFAKVLPKHPDTKLIMVGDTRSKRSMRRLNVLAKKLGIYKNVEFAGRHKNISPYLSKAYMHLLTSVNESFGLVITEAKAYGVPTVMYNLPYLELVREGSGIVTAEFCNTSDLADKLGMLLSDEGFRNKLGEAARESLEIFSNQVVIVKWSNLFADLINNKTDVFEIDTENEIMVLALHEAWINLMQNNYWKIKLISRLDSVLPINKDGTSFSYTIVKTILSLFKIKI